MAQIAANWAAQKLLAKELDKYKSKKPVSDEDPFFTYVTDKRNRRRKVKKQIPAYIPAHDALCLAKAKKWAYRLDMSLFTLFGIRFGWSSVLGIIPGFGDIADTLLAYLLVFRWCSRIEGGLPAKLWGLMVWNLVLDFAVGLIPFVGDVADAAFRANTKNVILLENHLKKTHAPKNMETEAKRRSGYRYTDKVDPDEAEDLAEHDYTKGQDSPEPRPTNAAEKHTSRWYNFSSGSGSSKKPLPPQPQSEASNKTLTQTQPTPQQQQQQQRQKSRSPPRPGTNTSTRADSPPKPPPK